MEGFHSVEEAAQEYIELFAALQQIKEERTEEAYQKKNKLFTEKKELLAEQEQQSGVFLPALYLRECFALTEAEYWLVMFAFCCEVEEGLCIDYCGGKEYWNGTWPTIRYALHLLSPVLSVSFALIAKLCGKKGGLGDILQLCSEDAEKEAERGLLSRPLILSRPAFYFLLTGELPQEEWYELFLTGSSEDGTYSQGMLPLHMREYAGLYSYLDRAGQSKVLLHGSRGSGKHTLVRRVCHARQMNAVFVKLTQLWGEKEQHQRGQLQELRLICRLAAPVLILDLTGGIFDDSFTEAKAHAWLEAFVSGEHRARHIIFLAEGAVEDELTGRLAEVRIDLGEFLTETEVKLALDAWLAPEERDRWQEQLLNGYRLNIGEFGRKQRAISLRAEAEHISPADRRAWEMGLPEQGGRFRLGRLIKADCHPDDLVLSEECRAQLETVTRIAEKWSGRGGLILFHGSSGTGKTMAASVIAGQLNRPLFKVDLSQIFDKYIGETEKHLDEIFRLARRSRYLLFFDEADALFARRTNIQDSHDKYANISTAYLLQRIEEHDGIVILATNLMDHLDDAFVRRIRFVIKFHNLDAEGRRRLWEKVLEGVPAAAEDVSLEALAQAVAFSPARIKSAAQVAKLLASGEGCETVTREHLMKALELEAGKDETAVKKFS